MSVDGLKSQELGRKEKKERENQTVIFDVPERIRNRGGEGAIVF